MKFFVLCAAAVTLALAGCGTSQTSPGSSDSVVVLATVGDVEITNVTIRNELELIPPYQRASFETPEGQRTLLDHLIERELLIQAAEDAGLESDSTVQAQVQQAMLQVEYARQRALITVFYEENVVSAVTVPDSAVQAYYDQHTGDIYFQPSQVKASMILTATSDNMGEVSAALAAGAPFDSTAMSMSEHSATAAQGGDLGWITVDSPLPYLGTQAEISTALFAAGTGSLVGPFETDLGFVLFEVADRAEAGPRPFEEVRESIVNILKPAQVNDYFRNTVIPDLREQYGVSINEDAFLPGIDVPADSLMELAQGMMETSPDRAIRYFQLYLERFPNDPKAYQAQFLIGFTYSEYMHDMDAAREAFANMVTRFPDTELTDDAQWMIDNMDRPLDSLIPQDSVAAPASDSI
jgi:parvulin-like peptidyl-prolyl isomerase